MTPRTSSQNADGTFEPFNEVDVPWEDFAHGARFGSRFKRLSKFGGGTHVGVSVEELPPGKQSCPFHYHMAEEEHLYVLAGTATLRLGENTYPLKPGDYCCFPAGQKAGHCLINTSTEMFRFIMIGEKDKNEVCVYPDSGRIGIRSLGEGYDMRKTMDYWEGEED